MSQIKDNLSHLNDNKKLKQNLGKKEIIENIHSSIGFSSKNIQKITDEIIEIIIEILKLKKKKINIKNFGSFNIVLKKERDGRNPKTKEKFKIKFKKYN